MVSQKPNEQQMSSREKILLQVKNNQPDFIPLPDISEISHEKNTHNDHSDMVEKYMLTLQAIGGHCKKAIDFNDIAESVKYQFPDAKRIVSTFSELKDIAEVYCNTDTINEAHNIDVAILGAHFGVAENSAVWLTEDIICDRTLPFICQHLVIVLRASNMVWDMHEAYKRIGNRDDGFSIFIAGPSKTADIEQSLVLGAHGPISMTVFILE